MNTLLSHVDEFGVATIILNRPQTHNAFNEQMIAEITECFEQLIKDTSVNIIVLKSEGKSFCAGADINWMQNIAGFSREENVKDAAKLAHMMHTIYHCPKPTIASVHGNAFGGGVGLVACCHIAIVASDANFCFSEVKLGLIPAVISPYIINAIGASFARALFLSGRTFNAQAALAMGLCHDVTDKEDLERCTQEWVQLLRQNGPQAMCAVNKLMNELEPMPISPHIANMTAQKIADIRVSEEGQEGLNAFLEKRKPRWVLK